MKIWNNTTPSFISNRERERERYTIKRGEEVETGDDEVGEGKVVDLLVLVRRRQQMVHHLQETDVPIPLEHRRIARR